MECQYCHSKFSTKSSLNKHIKYAKYCISKRNEKSSNEFKCSGCNKIYTSKYALNIHIENCIELLTQRYEEKIKELKEQLIEQKDQYETKIQHLQDKLENIAIKAVSRPFEDETTIDIEHDDFLSDSDFIIEETDDESVNGDVIKNIQKHDISPLEVGKGFTIDHREEDGYINITNLCKVGKKKFNDWKRLGKTKEFIKILNTETGIPVSVLIKTNKGGNDKNNQYTWVHPRLAINIAQWISPAFDYKVSGWVYEIMITGKVDITNTTPYKQLQEESKKKSIRIRLLEKMNLKRQPRTQYKEKYVIYILTTALMKKERRYILGKAKDLTPRLSTYNKSDEHKVIYYQSCGDEETMGCVETMVFQYLKQYREQANRERFILPENQKIELFTNTIKKSIEFFKK
jgi:hypothetical protein